MKITTKISARLAMPALFFSITFILFLIASFLFADLYILCIGLPFSFSAFFLGYNLFSENLKDCDFEISKRKITIILCALTIISSLAVIFIPNSDAGMIDWASVSSLNWLRYASTVLLTLFLPGYYLSRIILRNDRGLFVTLALSWLLSFLISFIIGFVQLVIFNAITSLSIYMILCINLLLMVFYLLISKRNTPVIKISTSFIEIGSILSTVAVIIIGNIYVMNATMPFSNGDMRVHLSLVLQYCKGFPIDNGVVAPYPFMFPVSLATIFQTSGIPSAIAYQSLFVIGFVPMISLFVLLSTWLPERKARVYGYILAPLLGFGSIYALFLKIADPSVSLLSVLNNAISKTYDVSSLMVIIPGLSNLVPLLLIELPALLLFIALLKKNYRSSVRIVLFSLLVSIAYLAHVSGVFFMAIILFLYLLFTKDHSAKDASIGGLIGLLLVLIIDVSVYPRSGTYILGNIEILFKNQLTYAITLAVFCLCYLFALLLRKQLKLSAPILNFSKVYDFLQKHAIPIGYVAFFVYLFSLIFWFWALPTYNAYTYGGFDNTPFFVWPLRFGALGLLFLFFISFIKKVNVKKEIVFLSAVILLAFVLEQLSNFVQLYPSYRFATLAWIAVLIISASTIPKIHFTTKLKKYVLSFALLLLILPGMFSLCFSYYYRGSVTNEITNTQIEALSYIKQNLLDNSSILTFSEDSANKLSAFAAVNELQIIQKWSNTVLKTCDLSVIIDLLAKTNTQYLYVDSLDKMQLNSSQGIFKYFMQICPVEFSNDDVTVYRIPHFDASSENPQILMFKFLNSSINYDSSVKTESFNNLLCTIPSLLQSRYQIVNIPKYTEEEYYLTILNDCASSLNWSVSEGSGSVEIDRNDFVKNTSVSTTDITTDKNGYFNIKLNQSINLENNDFITFWVKVPESVSKWLKVILRGDKDTYSIWVFTEFQTGEWMKVTVPLNNPYSNSEKALNFSAIKSLEIGFTSDPNQSLSSFKIDQISYGNVTKKNIFDISVIEKYANMTTVVMPTDINNFDDFDDSSLLDLVEKGLNVVVLGNFSEHGYIQDKLNLTISDYAFSNQIDSSIASFPSSLVPIVNSCDDFSSFLINYTYSSKYVSPFVVQKTVDKGNVFFINIAPLASLNMYDCLKIIDRTLFLLNSTLKFEGSEQTTVDSLPAYLNRVVEGNILANGLISVQSVSLLNINPIVSSELKISNNQEKYIFTNATIVDMKLFSSSLQLKDLKMKISPNSDYLFVELSTNNSSDIIITAEKCSIKIQQADEEINLNLENVTLNCNFSSLKLLSQVSGITVNGTAILEHATIAERPYVPLAGSVKKTLEVTGFTNMSIKSTSKDLFVLSYFNYEGLVRLIQEENSTLDWFSFFNSSYFLIFVLLTCVGISVILLSNRYNINIEMKKK